MVEEIKHADDLFTEFKAQSVSEFFRKNAAMLGYTGKIRSLTTLVHEAVTNSLDACEEARILPEIRVAVKQLGELHYRCTFEDNASGIPLSFISQVFGSMLAGSKAHRNIQSRGQQGIGISGAVMYSQVTTGQPTRIVTSTGDSHVIFADVFIDVERNIGKIIHKKKLPNGNKWRGTQIILEAKEVLYNKGKYSPYNYLKMTSISNPHASIIFIEPDGNTIYFGRSIEDVPPSPHVIKPHPYGVGPDDLLMMAKYSDKSRMSSFLVGDFVRISKARLDEIEKISKVNLGMNPKNLTWQESEKIVGAFKQIKFLAPSVEGLIPIGAENIKKSLDTTLAPEFSYATTRSPVTYRGGIPFIVECGIAYGGKAGNGGLEIVRYANRAPLVFDQGGCAISEAVASVDWKRYGIKDTETIPLTIFLNLISTHIPYTSAGKQAIANIDEIFSEMRFALMDVGRSASRFLSGKRRIYERRKRIDALRKYVPETSRAISRLTDKKEERVEKLFLKIIEKQYGEADEEYTEETL